MGGPLWNNDFLQLFGALIKKYEPETAKPPTEGPVNIMNQLGPDSLNKKDSGNKPK